MTPSLLLNERALEAFPTSVPPPAERLLHVEDNAVDALLTQEYLRSILPGIQIDTATRLSQLSPERASAADCAILDLSLPDATGLEALIALRALSDALPIIVLTGFDDFELALASLRFGADDYLIKNHADSYTLERSIRYAIERRRLGIKLLSDSAASLAALETSMDAVTALEAELQEVRDSAVPAGTLGRPPAEITTGTHEVSVHVEETTGDYAMKCLSCDWEFDPARGRAHTWADRGLDRVLTNHVDFGGLLHVTDGALGRIATAGPDSAEPAARGPRALTRRGFPTFGRPWHAPATLRMAMATPPAGPSHRMPTEQPRSLEEVRRAHPSTRHEQ